MAFAPGTRLGIYDITAQIGEGGMGQVYRATDSNLKRSVAIKVLPPAVAGDADRLARFQREAEVLAALNHPNIAAIYGLERTADVTALVMELVEGDDLSQRIARGAIEIDEALPIAKQIAEALEAAHGQGIIHRDLKPANIKVRADGTVKVLDFGLAKALDPAATSSAEAMNSPTLSLHATQPGMILGTAAYMSPEQARGRTVDKRSDIFSFGCVLYEMLTGKAAFEGEDVAEILGSVMKSEPDWSRLPSDTPSTVRTLLRLCLEKHVKNRRSDATDLRLDIEQAQKECGSAPMAAATPARTTRPAWIVAAIATIAFASITAAYFLDKAGTSIEAPVMRLSVTLPQGTAFIGTPAISPDGTRVAVVAADASGSSEIWIRPLASQDAKRLVVAAAEQLFWSPDSRWLAFFEDGKLKKLDADGGSPQVLADAPSPRGGTWNQDNVILFVPNSGGPLVRMSAAVGNPVPLVQTASLSPYWPQFLPDGIHFLFYSYNKKLAERSLHIGSLASDRIERIPSIRSQARYSPPGYLLFVERDALMAQRFDMKTLSLSGEPLPVGDGIASRPSTGVAYFAVSTNGVVTYRAGTNDTLVQPTWFDRTGQQAGTIGKPDTIASFRLSPDQKRLALDRSDPVTGKRDIWLIDDLASGIATRFTAEVAEAAAPVWSPDGKTILLSVNSGGSIQLHRKDSSGNGTAEPLTVENASGASDWSPDGRYLLRAPQGDLQLVPMSGSEPASWFLKTPFNEGLLRISPNGKWVAYVSDESGRQELYVQSFPKPGSKRRISSDGGTWPRWRGDGKELFYLAANRYVVAVPVDSGDAFNAGLPTPLFRTATLGGTLGLVDPFDVSLDGQRFLILPQRSSTEVSLILNWPSLLKP